MKLMTKELAAKLPALYSQDGKGWQAIAYAHYFIGGCDWYASEYDGEDTFFGLASIQEVELGYFNLSELASVRTRIGGVERDLYWTPKTLADCRAELRAKGVS